ncbi:vacuolar iron transporter homolog 3-like [Rhododendron vialii]|uniref:vacuolar iron transporter homolog 3-like n=1 Tax=Rhododendron vialii TaxID=182163 RepID=UPI00265DC4C6|nr:vacuolar iron transporter homolog 3-like [Rhododendron vialii]
MATSTQSQTNHPEQKPTIPDLDIEQQPVGVLEIEVINYSSRAQWLRAAVLGANDGLLSTASLMVGVGAVHKDVKTMILTGITGLIAGALSMAIGEFVSVYSQYDIEMAQIEREEISESEIEERKGNLPSPLQAAAASALSFAVGAFVPLIAAGFVKDYYVRLGVVVAAVSLALLGFGGLSAVLGRAPVVKPSLRVLIGGWLAMGLTYGLTKLIGSTGI